MKLKHGGLAVLGAAALVAGLTVYRHYQAAIRPAPPAAAPQPELLAAAASAPDMAASETLALPAPAQPVSAAGIGAALDELVGSKAVGLFLHTDDFARRLVATVDNLGREHAPAMVWPVRPTPGRFATERRASDTLISADNAARYTGFVQLVESVDPGRAADLYARMQPLLQRAYEALGFPGRRFDARLLQVIDLLLATPEPATPVALVLTEVKGPLASERPWQRYEYADPALESRPAGQKWLMRMGPVNERRLKGWLGAFRQQLLQRMQTR